MRMSGRLSAGADLLPSRIGNSFRLRSTSTKKPSAANIKVGVITASDCAPRDAESGKPYPHLLKGRRSPVAHYELIPEGTRDSAALVANWKNPTRSRQRGHRITALRRHHRSREIAVDKELDGFGECSDAFVQEIGAAAMMEPRRIAGVRPGKFMPRAHGLRAWARDGKAVIPRSAITYLSLSK